MPDIEQLYRAHGPALLSYVRRNFARFAAPEDLLQDAFAVALTHPGRLKAAVSPRAWLFGVARHLGLTAMRKYRVVESVDSREVPQPVASDDLIDLGDALMRLPQILREPLELRLREGLSYEEIAQVLEIPLGTVRSRLHTTMRRLREAMDVEATRSQSHER